jgi:hypothetical protein
MEVQGLEKEFYSALKEVYGPIHSTTVALKTADGSALITDKGEILARWKQHFSDLLNTPTISQATLDRIIALPEHSSLDMPPTIVEITTAVNKMRNAKAPGSDGIPAEIYKHGGNALLHRLHNLFKIVWSKEVPQEFKIVWRKKVPQEFKDASVVPIYKKKGDRAACENYRGISLLSIVEKY